MLGYRLKKLAVTGPMSAGKSTLCQFFKELGAYVVSADEIVHQLLSTSSTLTKQIIQLFGSEVIVERQIDRSQIAKKAFQQPALLQSLEDLLHPAVRDEIARRYLLAVDAGSYLLFVAEIPLLFETGADLQYDATLAVTATREQCLQRFKLSKGGSSDDYDQRMARQLSSAEKAARATYVIANDHDQEKLKKAVEAVFREVASTSSISNVNLKDRSLKL